MADSNSEAQSFQEIQRLYHEMEIKQRVNEVLQEQRDRCLTDRAELERKNDGLKVQCQSLQRRLHEKDEEIKRLKEELDRVNRHVLPCGETSPEIQAGPFSSTRIQGSSQLESRRAANSSFLSPIPIPNKASEQPSSTPRAGNYQQHHANDIDDMQNALVTPSGPSEERNVDANGGNESGEVDIFTTAPLRNAFSPLNLHTTTIADDDRTGWLDVWFQNQFLLVKLRSESYAKSNNIGSIGYPTNGNPQLACPVEPACGSHSSYGGANGENRAPTYRGRGGRVRRGRVSVKPLATEHLYLYFVARVLATKLDQTPARQNHMHRVYYYRKMIASTPAMTCHRSGQNHEYPGQTPESLYFIPYENKTLFEVDEEAVVAKLPPPQFQRRGQVKFNFSFQRYHLG